MDGPHLSVISVFIFLYLRGGRSGEAGVSYPSISFLYFHTEYANNTNILCLLFCTDIATNIHSLPGAGRRNMNNLLVRELLGPRQSKLRLVPGH